MRGGDLFLSKHTWILSMQMQFRICAWRGKQQYLSQWVHFCPSVYCEPFIGYILLTCTLLRDAALTNYKVQFLGLRWSMSEFFFFFFFFFGEKKVRPDPGVSVTDEVWGAEFLRKNGRKFRSPLPVRARWRVISRIHIIRSPVDEISRKKKSQCSVECSFLRE